MENLVKLYPGVRAVDGISFAIEPGEFFGFLGPNGAGKSTAIKILATLTRKTSGKVLVTGYDPDPDANPRAVRRAIGFAMQEVGLDDLATGRENLVLQGLLYGLSRDQTRRRSDEWLLDLLGLNGAPAGRKVGTYSGGMRRRLDLAMALVHRPKFLFLDEPTTGLDPQSRMAIWEHLEHLNREEGVTIFLTTQYMEEADRLCQRISIIDLGKLVAEGTPTSLKAEFPQAQMPGEGGRQEQTGIGHQAVIVKDDIGADVVNLSLDSDSGDADSGVGGFSRAQEMLEGWDSIEAVQPVNGGLSVHVKDGGAAIPRLLKLLGDGGILVTSLTLHQPTLDDVFLKHTGRSMRVEDTRGEALAGFHRALQGRRRQCIGRPSVGSSDLLPLSREPAQHLSGAHSPYPAPYNTRLLFRY